MRRQDRRAAMPHVGERLVITAWIRDGKILVDAQGNVILCDKCPCEGAVHVPCCSNGVILEKVYFWFAVGEIGASVGCIPNPCAGTGGTDAFIAGQVGPFHYGYIADPHPGGTNPGESTAFVYDAPTFSRLGCVNVRFRGACGGLTDLPTYRQFVAFDVGSGFDQGGTGLDAGDVELASTYDESSFSPTRCQLDLGCFADGGGGFTYYLATEPIETIPVPDLAHSNIPTSLTVSMTLIIGGMPTPFTMDLLFAPFFASGAYGNISSCYNWVGWLACSGICSPVTITYGILFPDTVAKWRLSVTSTFLFWEDPAFPTMGTYSGGMVCADASTDILWSVTE